MTTVPDIDAMPKVMGDDGQFHATDEAVDLSHTTIEGWVSLVIFWMLGFACFGLCQKSLDLAIDKKIDALVAESEEPIGLNE